jgi:hypothetical protein
MEPVSRFCEELSKVIPMTNRSERLHQAFWASTLLIFAILVTGGSRFAWIDLRSLGVWSIIALILFLSGGASFGGDSTFALRVREGFNKISRRPTAILIAVFAAIGTAHTLRYLTLGVYYEDAGYVYQSLFHTFTPTFLHCDVCAAGSYLGEHQAYTLVFGKLWTLLFRTPYAVPFLFAGIGFATFYVFVRSERKRHSAWLLSFLILALLSVRGFRNAYLFDFREDALGALFFSFALAGAFARKPIPLFIGGILGALSKESGALLLPIFAGVLLFDFRGAPLTRPVRFGFLALSLLLAVFCFGYGLPRWASEGSPSMLMSRYGSLGSTPGEIALRLLSNPLLLLGFGSGGMGVFVKDHLRYLVFTVGPFLPFMIRAWNPIYLVGLAAVGMNWVSPSAMQRSMTFHYELFALPFFAFALSRSVAELREKGLFQPRFAGITFFIFLAISGTWPMSKVQEGFRSIHRVRDAAFVRRKLDEIPAELPVLADAITYPQAVDRLSLRLFPEGGRAGKSSADGRFAVLRKTTFEAQDPAWKASWTVRDCSESEEICLYEKP